MKITNKLNLPEELVKAVQSKGAKDKYTASMLDKSARMVWLPRRHFEDIEEDVSDRIWALFGSAVHSIISSSETAQSLTEEYMVYQFDDGTIISGMADLYKDKKISDWKVKSVWNVIFFDKTEYETQLNVYAFLHTKYGFEVNELEIVMILRDWQRSKALIDPSYPQEQVKKFKIDLWPMDKTEKYIYDRIQYFEKYKNTPDNELPECTLEERWAKPGKWALMKKGAKRAIKLFDEKPNTELLSDQYFEKRTGKLFVRCEYCNARQFCNQYNNRDEGV